MSTGILVDEAAAHTQLRRGALRLWDDVVIAVASTAPAYSIATSLAVLAGAVALGGPAAIWLGFIPVTGIAVAYYYMNRADPNCGASYSWVSRTMSPIAGYFNGWVVIVADLFFMSFAAPQAGQATLTLLNQAHVNNLGPLSLSAGDQYAPVVVGVVWLAIVTWMVMIGIRLAARFQWVLLGIEYLIVLGFAILGLFKGGGSSFSLSWFNPFGLGGLSGLAAGVVISVFFYWGWDTAANINEETEDSNDNPGRAGIIGMFLLLLLFVIACVAIQMVLTPKEIQDNGSQVLTAFAAKMVGNNWAALASLAFLSSTIATLQTTLLPTARVAFSMGRDGVLGRVWARVHPTWRTPAAGTLIFGVIAGLVAILSTKVGGLNAVVSAGVTSIGVLVAFYYGMVGIASALFYRRAARRSVSGMIFAVIYPLLSAIVLIVLAVYLLWTNWTSSGSFAVDATNGKFLTIVPIVMILSGVVGLAWALIARRPAYFRQRPEVAADDALVVTRTTRAGETPAVV